MYLQEFPGGYVNTEIGVTGKDYYEEKIKK